MNVLNVIMLSDCKTLILIGINIHLQRHSSSLES